LSDLEMAGVEDTADILMTCDIDGRPSPVHVHLDFVQRPVRRFGHILCSKGALDWDYLSNRLSVTSAESDKTDVFRAENFRRNDMFEAELSDFVEAIRDGRPCTVPLEDGVRTLEVCLAARRAMFEGTVEVP
jgi:predicted dehydrogenase